MTEKKITDFFDETPEHRLQIALKMIGVENSDPKHQRHNIVSSIMFYAGCKGDSALEKACEDIIESIKAE